MRVCACVCMLEGREGEINKFKVDTKLSYGRLSACDTLPIDLATLSRYSLSYTIRGWVLSS